jgi:hypothetical protein
MLESDHLAANPQQDCMAACSRLLHAVGDFGVLV